MTRAELTRLLERLAPDLDALSEPWMVIGSGAMILAGADWPDCADLDVATTAAGAKALEAAWAAWRLAGNDPAPDGPFRSRFSRYEIPPGAVEVMGDLEVLGPDGWAPLAIRTPARHPMGGRTWPAPDLAEQVRILRRFGRPKDLVKAAFLQGSADLDRA
ncbi:MAG TPA: hypothetical protein VFW47_02550 [Phenylobacterium sp.]|nr:hypothetical protein [Phenylobacterium sp.]